MNEIIRNVRVITGPAYEPVSVAEARTWCRIDSDIDDDALLTLLIGAARERAETLTGMSFIQRDLELRMDDLPNDDSEIELPYGPLQYVTSIEYRDTGGAVQVLTGSPDSWITDTTGSRISPVSGWPSTDGSIANVRIVYRAGYAPGSPDDEAGNQEVMPKLLKAWMQLRVGSFYEHRESVIVGGQVVEMPRDFVDGLLDGLKVSRGFA